MSYRVVFLFISFISMERHVNDNVNKLIHIRQHQLKQLYNYCISIISVVIIIIIIILSTLLSLLNDVHISGTVHTRIGYAVR